jgi:hypothetical protein
MNHWPGQLNHEGTKIVMLTCGWSSSNKKWASETIIRNESETISHKILVTEAGFVMFLAKTKIVAITVNTLQVEKYKTITNPSFAPCEVICRINERINNAKRKV